MGTEIAPMLAVSDGNAAIAFYTAAFGATFLWHLDGVDDPVAVHRQALHAGAIEHSPVKEHTHAMTGPHPIRRMLQGAVVDPFGHMWLVGKILE
jgi:uncharacterized glyoxalase superfamily protein PhnB